jgi:hypothetical protein
MIVTPEDRFVLLEANPTGQWAWIQKATGLPICETLVDLLSGNLLERERLDVPM